MSDNYQTTAANLTTAVRDATIVPNPVFQSRFGFHPCDYQTFAALKKLHRFMQPALIADAKHERWERKAVQNRVYRQKIKNEKGQVIKREIVLDSNGNPIPIPEPKMCPVLVPWELVEQDYQNARMPKKRDDVKPLRLEMTEINNWLDQCLKWQYKGDKTST